MNKLNNVSDSLALTINEGELQNVSIDIAETIGDSFLNDGILKDLPIFGTILGITKGTLNIRDQLFIKKLIYFLSELSQISVTERQAQISKIESSTSYKNRVGEKLLYIIDKSEDAQKASLIGKLFCSFLREEINYETFLKCSNAIQNLFISDIFEFINSNERIELDKSSQYISVGLMMLVFVPPKLHETSNMFFSNAMDGDPDVEYTLDPGVTFSQITPLGKTLRKVLSGNNSQI
jgi:hypothetical protein